MWKSRKRSLKEKIKFYQNILNLFDVNSDSLLEIYFKYKDQDIVSNFYDDINRDPRGYTVSHVFYGFTNDEPKAESDAKSIIKVKFSDLNDFLNHNEIAFDHKKILSDFIVSFNKTLKNNNKKQKRPL